MKKELDISEDRTSAPFNMALFTLEKIHNILKRIAEVDVLYITDSNDQRLPLTPGNAQHMKYRLLKTLFVQSVPLLNSKETKKWQEETLKKIRDLKLMYGDRISNGRVIGKFEAYYSNIDYLIDDLIIAVEKKLQEEGYFMPDKRDPRFSWKLD